MCGSSDPPGYNVRAELKSQYGKTIVMYKDSLSLIFDEEVSVQEYTTDASMLMYIAQKLPFTFRGNIRSDSTVYNLSIKRKEMDDI